MNYRPAAVYVDFDDDAVAGVGACRSTVSDDDSAEDDMMGALTQRVCSSPSPVDLLRAIPAVNGPPLTSTRTVMLAPQLTACCRTCDDFERLRKAHVENDAVAGDAACTCAGVVPSKPSQHGPMAPFLAPPPAPRRSRTLPTERRRRVNDAYTTCTSGDFDVTDVESAASMPTHRFDCFRFCCFRSSCSSKPEQETTSRRTTETNDVVGLTTVCRCSAVLDENGKRNGRHTERNSKLPRGTRRHRVIHVLIACLTALPVTCLVIVGLFLMMSHLHQSTTGTFSHNMYPL